MNMTTTQQHRRRMTVVYSQRSSPTTIWTASVLMQVHHLYAPPNAGCVSSVSIVHHPKRQNTGTTCRTFNEVVRTSRWIVGIHQSLHRLPGWIHREFSSGNTASKENVKTTTNGVTTTNPIPNFEDTASAFASKTNQELVVAAMTFGLCQFPYLVRNAERILYILRHYILGNSITDMLLRATLFGHFCAGIDEQDIQPTISKLHTAGIGSILDFAAEDTDDHAAQKKRRKKKSNVDQILQHNNPNVRMYDYESEAQCDRHCETFRQCIQSVRNLHHDGGVGFAAIKVTALGNPQLLARMSRAIIEAQNLFSKFDTNNDGFISQDEFDRGIDLFFNTTDASDSNSNNRSNSTISQWRERIATLMPTSDDNNHDNNNNHSGGGVDFITWSMLLGPSDLPYITSGLRSDGPLGFVTLTQEEADLIDTMYQRCHQLAQEAAIGGTRLLIDAEQVRFQPAIDSLVLDLQRTYNATTTSNVPLIYNTYQCYLKDASTRLQADVERARRYNFHFGAKLVRGAYMESERALAESLGVPSPIHETIQDTHDCYNDAVRYLLQYSQQTLSLPSHDAPMINAATVEFMCATHNQETIELAIAAMNEMGIDRTSHIVSFAQLYGMKDNLTFNLGRHGFRAYKYVPYGPVQLVMPYLLRRANENSAIAGSTADEWNTVVQELKRRLVGKRVR